MPSHDPTVPLPGSRFRPLRGAVRGDRVRPAERMQVTLVLRRREPFADPHATALERHARGAPHPHREEHAARHGAHPDDVARVVAFAAHHGLRVLRTCEARRTVVLEGTAARFSRALRVELHRWEHARGAHRGTSGAVHVPEALSGIVMSVLGLHDRPLIGPMHPGPPLDPGRGRRPARPRRDVGRSMAITELADVYGFPPAHDGAGECVAIVELAGGYHHGDVELLFDRLGARVPEIVPHGVHAETEGAAAGGNDPCSPEAIAELLAFFDGRPATPTEAAIYTYETTMDVEIAAALAPGARHVVYFAASPDVQGLYNAIAEAVHDTRRRPSVISLSWGWPELDEIHDDGAVSDAVRALDALLEDAAAIGITVCVSSGDDGSSWGSPDGTPCVQLPASSPHVLGCGGTTLRRSPAGRIDDEVVWNAPFGDRRYATGGGVSRIFDRPAWQADRGVPAAPTTDGFRGRGVPDVAALADRRNRCRLVVGGLDGLAAGTSAAAPLWAALVARLNHALGRRVGFVNPLVYRLTAGAGFREITEGDNGDYAAGPGWNPCTGLGSPIGRRLLAELRPGRAR